jgi:hypothetical protein
MASLANQIANQNTPARENSHRTALFKKRC